MSVTQNNELRDAMNACRFDATSVAGHYESYFLRANHPERPQAFWIRYTIFLPKGAPERAIGELWAAYFDGDRDLAIASKTEVPISECVFSDKKLDARIGAAHLGGRRLQGTAANTKRKIAWDLTYSGDNAPLLFLPAKLYEAKLPKAKAFVGNPGAVFTGTLTVDGENIAGENIAVENWRGSENHNWGSKHTDEYAWGQVAGFDNAPEAFLECATARTKLGPVWTPKMTVLVVRVGGREYALNNIAQTLKAKGDYTYFDWRFRSQKDDVVIEGHIHAPKEHFVGLNYYNPPGGSHTCLNSKIASCVLTVAEEGKETIQLEARNRAAFEILTDDVSHGVAVVA